MTQRRLNAHKVPENFVPLTVTNPDCPSYSHEEGNDAAQVLGGMSHYCTLRADVPEVCRFEKGSRVPLVADEEKVVAGRNRFVEGRNWFYSYQTQPWLD